MLVASSDRVLFEVNVHSSCMSSTHECLFSSGYLELLGSVYDKMLSVTIMRCV